MPNQVTVVVPCFNSAAFIGETLRSALGQSYRSLDIVVVNDGSTDGIHEVLAPFLQKIRLIDQRNQGVSAARNAAIDASGGQYIAFLDADDLWEPTKIERQVAFLEQHPEIGVVHTDRRLIGGAGEPVRPRARLLPRPAEGWCLDDLIQANSIILSSVMVRRATLGSRRFLTPCDRAEDWQMWIDLARDVPFGFIDERLTAYRVHAQGASADSIKMLRAMAAVADHTVGLERLSDSARELARASRRMAFESLANAYWDRGDFKQARATFRMTGSGVTHSRRRYVMSAFPLWLLTAVRKMRLTGSQGRS